MGTICCLNQNTKTDDKKEVSLTQLTNQIQNEDENKVKFVINDENKENKPNKRKENKEKSVKSFISNDISGDNDYDDSSKSGKSGRSGEGRKVKEVVSVKSSRGNESSEYEVKVKNIKCEVNNQRKSFDVNYHIKHGLIQRNKEEGIIGK
jgi:hypothetical protein